MRVVDVEGQLVGFVREVKGQNLVIGRPAASDIQVSMSSCKISTEIVKLSLYRREVAKMGHSEQDDWDFTRFNR